MAETIICPIGDAACNCTCNCQAFLKNDRVISVDPLEIDGNEYTFSYTMTNSDPAISNVVFCIQCPTSKIIISEANTSIQIIGNPTGTPIAFTRCYTSGCQSAAVNRYYANFDFEDENCCRYQGIKIDINPSNTINEITFKLIFTLPDDVSFGFNSENLKLKSGQIIDIVNDLCMPGCANECNIQINICNMWQREKNILKSNKNVFIHFTQLVLPPSLDLNTITVDELEKKARAISKLEKSTANMTCNIAKVLEKLNDLKVNNCYTQ